MPPFFPADARSFRHRRAALAVLLSAFAGTGATAQVSTLTWEGPLQPAPVVTGARDLAAADLNGDGAAEIAVLRAADVAIIRNNGLGFTLAQSLPADASAVNLRLVDLDGDGDADLSLADGTGVRTWLNAGGTLSAADTFALAGIQDHDYADLDGNGLADLVVVEAATPDFRWYPGNGAGGFSNPADGVLRQGLGESLAFTDLDGDGDTDIASAEEVNDFWRYLNPGNGALTGFGQVADFVNVRQPRGIDIDSNALGDLCAIEGNRIVQFIQAAADSFQARRTVGNDFLNPADLVVGDVDADGKQDIVASAAGDGVISYWLASSRGTFSSFEDEALVDSLDAPGRLVLADMDADGDLDLLAIGGADARVYYYKANNAPCSVFDVATNLQATLTLDSMILTWDPAPGALACRAEGAKEVGSAFKGLDLVTGPGPHRSGLRLTVLKPGQSYKWRVRCVCSLFPLEAGVASPQDTFAAPAPLRTMEGGARLLGLDGERQLDWGAEPAGELRWEIVDLTGRVLAAGRGTAERVRLDLGALPAGVYVLWAEDGLRREALPLAR
jgi:hypothetical protein